MTSLSGEYRFVYVHSVLFASMQRVCFSRNACIFKFAADPTPLLFEVKLLSKNLKFYGINQYIRAKKGQK